MSPVWIVASVLAWAVVALLVAVVLALMKQVGELRSRIDRLGEDPTLLADRADGSPGAALYDPVEPFDARVLHAGDATDAVAADAGATLTLGGIQDRPALLVVHGPGCMSCAGIEDALLQLTGDDPDAEPVRVLSVLALGERYAVRHLEDHPLHGVPTVRFDDLPDALKPESTPALVGIAREGIVCALGRPAGLDDLREAVQACDEAVLLGAPDSVRITDWGETVPFWEANDDPIDVLEVGTYTLASDAVKTDQEP